MIKHDKTVSSSGWAEGSHPPLPIHFFIFSPMRESLLLKQLYRTDIKTTGRWTALRMQPACRKTALVFPQSGFLLRNQFKCQEN